VERELLRQSLDFLKKIDSAAVPVDLEIHLVLNHYGEDTMCDNPPMVPEKAALPCAFHLQVSMLMAQPDRVLIRTTPIATDQMCLA
jgi:hypothetical protein